MDENIKTKEITKLKTIVKIFFTITIFINIISFILITKIALTPINENKYNFNDRVLLLYLFIIISFFLLIFLYKRKKIVKIISFFYFPIFVSWLLMFILSHFIDNNNPNPNIILLNTILGLGYFIFSIVSLIKHNNKKEVKKIKKIKKRIKYKIPNNITNIIEPDNLVMYTASKTKRLINLILDFVFCFMLSMIIGSILGIYVAIMNANNINDPLKINLFLNSNNHIINYIIGFIIFFLYYFIFEYLCNKSISKYFTKTQVISLKGSKPKISSILIRTLSRFIPFEWFSFIKSDIGWHDILSKTYVIDLKILNKIINNNEKE